MRRQRKGEDALRPHSGAKGLTALRRRSRAKGAVCRTEAERAVRNPPPTQSRRSNTHGKS
jgi:hypothetical protein